jgi:glycosyltransferase involved in cell wall biosynthesis
MRRLRIVICAAQVPFVRGGAEIHVEALARELSKRGHAVEIVRLPFKWYPKVEILKGALAWRLLDLSGAEGEAIDLVIATKFPSYLVRHPRKVTWLIHQFRSAYDLFGTPFGDLQDTDEDRRLREIIREMDRRCLGESRRLFTNAGNTARRLFEFNGIRAEPLYHPPTHEGRYRCSEYGNFVLAVSRLNKLKRLDLLVRAMVHVPPGGLRAIVIGDGPERGALEALIQSLGVADRVELRGAVSDEDLLESYARCRCVFFAPFDEDYGYITLEAFRSRKAVLTAADSGGPLEFVSHGESGYVLSADEPTAFAEHMVKLWQDTDLAQRLGEDGHERVAKIGWDDVVEKLLADLH